MWDMHPPFLPSYSVPLNVKLHAHTHSLYFSRVWPFCIAGMCSVFVTLAVCLISNTDEIPQTVPACCCRVAVSPQGLSAAKLNISRSLSLSYICSATAFCVGKTGIVTSTLFACSSDTLHYSSGIPAKVQLSHIFCNAFKWHNSEPKCKDEAI